MQGSVEAVADALAKLSTEKVRVAIIHAGVGAITEGDINLAVASKAIVIGFGVRPAGKAAQLAESEGIEIRLYNIIYNAVDDVRKAMAGLLAPTLVEKALGKAEVRQVFKVGKVGAIAGCMVTDGTIKRSGKCRLVRDGVAGVGRQNWRPSPVQGRRRHRSSTAWSAASCSTATPTCKRATSSSATKSKRSRPRCNGAGARRVSGAASLKAPGSVHRSFGDVGEIRCTWRHALVLEIPGARSLKDKRQVVRASKSG